MKRAVKRIVLALSVLLVLFVGLSMYLKSLDFNNYKSQLQRVVQKATGRTLEIDGRLALNLSLRPSLSVDGLHFGNAAWASRKNMINVKRLEVEVQLLPLLTGQLVIEHIVMLKPDIALETNASGEGNWKFSMPATEGGALANKTSLDSAEEVETGARVSMLTLPQVGHFSLRNAHFSYRDGKSDKRWQLNVSRAELNSDISKTEIPLRFSLQMQYRKIPVTINGSIASIQALANNEPIQFDVLANVATTDINLTGSIARPLDAKGLAVVTTIKSKSTAQLARVVGISLVRDAPLSVHATLLDDVRGLVAKQIKVVMAGMDISGNASLRLDREKPYIEAALTSKKVDIGNWFPKRAEPSAQTERRLFSTKPLDLSVLRDVDGKLAWQVDTLLALNDGAPDFRQVDFKQVNMQLALDKGILAIKSLRARIAAGDLLATLRLDATLPSVKFKASMRTDAILAGRLLNGDGESMLEKGPIKMRITLAGSGVSVAEMMARLNGKIKIIMGKARVKTSALNLIGGDLLMSMFNKINPFSKSPPFTELKCGVAHFRVENGMMLSRNGIAFETARMNILSHGKINLHDESIDLSIGTEPREGLGLSVSNMVNVIKLGGTLAKPSLIVDVGKTGKTAARVVGAVATGGLSLLGEGLFNRLTADKSPCQSALEMQ